MTDTILPGALRGPRTVILSDSWGEGTGQDLIARRLKRTVQAVRTRKYVLNKCRLVELGLKAKKP